MNTTSGAVGAVRRLRSFFGGCLLLVLTLLAASAVDHQKGVGADELAAAAADSSTTPLHLLLTRDTLIEPFSDSKLSAAPQPTAASQKEDASCFDLIGCFSKIPLATDPQAPQELATEFRLHNKFQFITVPFKPVYTCLQHKPDQCETYPYNLQFLTEPHFNPKARLVVLVGGSLSGARDSDWLYEAKERWVELEEDANVIRVQWQPTVAGGSLESQVANTRVVARQITVLLYYLAKQAGFELTDERFLDKIQLVGHSLGAHIAGFVGEDLGGKLGRITGLDPAGSLFNELDAPFRLDRADALLVDVLHTNAGALQGGGGSDGSDDPSSSSSLSLGLEHPAGHVDYYANNGIDQPNCEPPSAACSHDTATELYLSSLDHELLRRADFKLHGQQSGGEQGPVQIDQKSKMARQHRLFAYKSDTYEHFSNGQSLAELCPLTVAQTSPSQVGDDLDKCALPIDFAAPNGEFRRELRDRYKVNFDPQSESDLAAERPLFYYFHTSKVAPLMNDHLLVRVRTERDESEESRRSNRIRCDSLELDLTMEAVRYKQEIRRHQGLDAGGSNDTGAQQQLIAAPILALGSEWRRQLARLAARNFYLANDDIDNEQAAQLRAGLEKVFPSSVAVAGRIFTGETLSGGCQESIVRSVIVQPLMKLERFVGASYRSHPAGHRDPFGLVIVRDIGKLLSNVMNQNSHDGDEDDDAVFRLKSGVDSFVSTIFLGPRNDKYLEDSDSGAADAANGGRSVGDGEKAEVPDSSLVSTSDSSSWFVTIVMIAMLIAALSLVSVLAIQHYTRPSDQRGGRVLIRLSPQKRTSTTAIPVITIDD